MRLTYRLAALFITVALTTVPTLAHRASIGSNVTQSNKPLFIRIAEVGRPDVTVRNSERILALAKESPGRLLQRRVRDKQDDLVRYERGREQIRGRTLTDRQGGAVASTLRKPNHGGIADWDRGKGGLWRDSPTQRARWGVLKTMSVDFAEKDSYGTWFAEPRARGGWLDKVRELRLHHSSLWS